MPEPMLSLEGALERMLAVLEAPLGVEDAPLDEALDRVLAEPIRSNIDLPPWDNSAMDGFAVHAADTVGATLEAPVRLRVVGEVKAGGSPDLAVPAGCAARIATGAPVPPTADAIVPVEATTAPGGLDESSARHDDASAPTRAVGFRPAEPLPESCFVVESARLGDNIRLRGEDVRAGTELLEAGCPLTPAQIGLAAGVGLSSLRVHRRPVVGVLSTGDELRLPGQDLGSSGIPDANRPGLLAACRSVGATAVDLGIARDSLESVLAALRPTIERADALIVTGGVSAGPYDVVRMAFEALGSVDLWRVAIQPGKPFAFGRSNPRDRDGRRVLLFGLPGNPVATLVTFELFVRPALQRLSGSLAPALVNDRAVTEDALRAASGRRGFLRVKVARDENGRLLRDSSGRLRVRLAGSQGSHVLSVLAVADALAIVPEAVGRLEPGDDVDIRWLGRDPHA
jgi:molybdopterin molybdotransferase